jgi:hypothetical protein
MYIRARSHTYKNNPQIVLMAVRPCPALFCYIFGLFLYLFSSFGYSIFYIHNCVRHVSTQPIPKVNFFLLLWAYITSSWKAWNCIAWLRSRKPRLTAVGIRCADHATPSTHKVGTNFADKRRLLGRYSSLADYGHGVYYYYLLLLYITELYVYRLRPKPQA